MSSLPKPAATTTPLLSQFSAALAEKRARRAWGLAKDLFKAMPDAQLPKEELRAAFGLRLQSLLDEGVAREAVLMYDQVVANRPWLANPLPLALRMSLGREGAKIVPDPALTVAESAGDDTELQRCLQQEVVDLRAIAEGPVLPANSPWRAEAQLLLAAWGTLESGARLPALQAISRRSPLLAWRLFLQALDAFYHHEDEQLAANVERIPSDSPLRPVALYLREVAQNAKVPEGDWQTELATKMGAGQSLHARLVVVDRVFSSGQKKMAIAQLNGICQELVKNDQQIVAIDLLSVLARQTDSPDTFFRQSPIATANEYLIVFRKFMGSSFFSTEVSPLLDNERFMRTLSDMEKALLAAMIAQQALPVDRSMFSSMMRAFGMGDMEDEMPEVKPSEMFVRSIGFLPLSSTYQAYTRWLEKNKPSALPAVLKQWAADFPEDTEPLRCQLAELLLGDESSRLFDVFSRLRELLGAGNADVRRCQSWVSARVLVDNKGNAAALAQARQWLTEGTTPMDQRLRLGVAYLQSPTVQQLEPPTALLELGRPRLVHAMLKVLAGARRSRLHVPFELTTQRGDGTLCVADMQDAVDFFAALGDINHTDCLSLFMHGVPDDVPNQDCLALLHHLIASPAVTPDCGLGYMSIFCALTERLLRDPVMKTEAPLLLTVRAWIWCNRQKLNSLKRDYDEEPLDSKEYRRALHLLAAATKIQNQFPMNEKAKKSVERMQCQLHQEIVARAKHDDSMNIISAWAVAICEVRNIGKTAPTSDAETRRTIKEIIAGTATFPPETKPARRAPAKAKTTVAKPKVKKARKVWMPPQQPNLFE